LRKYWSVNGLPTPVLFRHIADSTWQKAKSGKQKAQSFLAGKQPQAAMCVWIEFFGGTFTLGG
jgi:hypothetical protein